MTAAAVADSSTYADSLLDCTIVVAGRYLFTQDTYIMAQSSAY